MLFTERKDYTAKIKEHNLKYFNQIETMSKEIYNSNTIEGNTLSLSDTKDLLSNEKSFEDLNDLHSHKEIQEVLNLKSAIKYLGEIINDRLTRWEIANLHSLLMKDILDMNDLGVFRNRDVYTYVKEDNGELVKHAYLTYTKVMDAMYSLLDIGEDLDLKDIAKFKLKFVSIHPFIDGNGRISRLLLNWLLSLNNYPLITIEASKKEEYIHAMSSYSKDGNSAVFEEMLQGIINDKLEEIFTD